MIIGRGKFPEYSLASGVSKMQDLCVGHFIHSFVKDLICEHDNGPVKWVDLCKQVFDRDHHHNLLIGINFSINTNI